MIAQSQARALAEQHCRAELGAFAYAADKVLREDCLETDYCWMFFMSDAYLLPEDAAPAARYAHVVSKKGRYAKVRDFSGDAARLDACLHRMSAFFRDSGA